jgi:hypothetical protein
MMYVMVRNSDDAYRGAKQPVVHRFVSATKQMNCQRLGSPAAAA